MSVIIIAEAGVNHNGDINLAKKLVGQAKRARAMCSDINLIALKVDTLIAQGYQLRKQEHQNDFLKYSKKI